MSILRRIGSATLDAILFMAEAVDIYHPSPKVKEPLYFYCAVVKEQERFIVTKPGTVFRKGELMEEVFHDHYFCVPKEDGIYANFPHVDIAGDAKSPAQLRKMIEEIVAGIVTTNISTLGEILSKKGYKVEVVNPIAGQVKGREGYREAV